MEGPSAVLRVEVTFGWGALWYTRASYQSGQNSTAVLRSESYQLKSFELEHTVRSTPSRNRRRRFESLRRAILKPILRPILAGLLLALGTVGVSSCGQNLYKFPQYTFANRPIPPSKLASRVMVALTNGGTGALEILDANRDIRSNVQNTIKTFFISGYTAGFPNLILNFPEQLTGYVYSSSDGSLTPVNYGAESAGKSVGTFPGAASIAIAADFGRTYAANEVGGQMLVVDNTIGQNFPLNLPGVYRVAVNQGGTVALAMVRNSDTLYRVVKLNAGQTFANNPSSPLMPPGAVDCQPYNLPVYCVVPVPGAFNRPIGAYFSLDGTTAYVLNCGTECGGPAPASLPGSSASVSLVQQGPLNINTIPTSVPYISPVAGNVGIPGGVTTAVSDGTTLYLAGQQLQTDGLFAGRLTRLNLGTLTASAPVSISDGSHTRMLFADDNTLWIGSQFCATGERFKLFSAGDASQNANYNCLTRFDLGAGTAQIVPAVNQAAGSTTAVTVPYPNQNGDQFYYGSLTGLCWVQNLHKVYTAYGGQVHAFHTADGSEINNYAITVQGTALDVAYMDAVTNAAD